ncbi:MAG TPA: ROK family protein [Acidimicrobiales bacterium]|nr:ROK family protein [Acidimicrobiales bacterium]
MKVGVDLGGTKIFAIATDEGQVVGELKAKTPVLGGPLAVVDAIVSVVRELGDGGPLDTVGIGAPGAVDFATGEVRRAPNLKGWMDPFPLGPTLAEALGGVNVVVDNDVNVGTVAEHELGAAIDCPDVMGLFVGTGVGAGLILDGRLRRGPTGFAGEIGHVVVRPGGRRCGCGGRGHLEAYAGRAGMERRARQHHARGMDTVLVEWSKARRMTSSVFARALGARDRVAVSLIDRAVETLGQAIATAVTLLDVPLVVVGGGLADRLGPPFVERIQEASLAAMPSGQADNLRVIPGALGDRGGALGAAVAAGARVALATTATTESAAGSA